MVKKTIIGAAILILILIAGFGYFNYEVYYGHGGAEGNMNVDIVKGDGVEKVALKLKDKNLIPGKIYLYYYLKIKKLSGKILPGVYELNGQMTIPEIATIITEGKISFVRVTFPEGWDAKKMAERLSANGFNGDEFLKLIEKPEQFRERYAFLADPSIKTLEGYLFPDTYFLKKDTEAYKIISKMLDNFNGKLTADLRNEIKNQEKSIRDEIIMASVIEREVNSEGDRAIVSGIFWSRIKIGQPLQSCATLAYILGVNKKQYSLEDTRINSPFNTYLNKGLPPAPIANPGLAAIKAAIYPKNSDYNYFLSDPDTGQTIFSKNLEEHNANKAKYGL
ncbi:MAG: endolytic transglycosylase MltG [Candidatus Moranbacteria bacterium]|nr:endolytic transglycosylase MltG [Candidatus Moranbacteria bacterium]